LARRSSTTRRPTSAMTWIAFTWRHSTPFVLARTRHNVSRYGILVGPGGGTADVTCMRTSPEADGGRT
jgi:hypothetical protein